MESDKKLSFTEEYNLPDPVCINKWGFSTIHMSLAETMSCHRVAGDKITPETYGDFHNTPSKLRDRQEMMNGQWPTKNGPLPKSSHSGCEVCRKVEAAGGISDRLRDNRYSFDPIVPKETKIDPTNIKTTPRILEVFFNNQCNQACIYCAPRFSSLIAAEEHRYNSEFWNDEIKKISEKRKDYPRLLKAHFDWMKENAQFLFQYNILGGEPFFQPETEDNLNFFMENKCPNLRILMFSNLNVDKDKLRNILDKIKFLKNNNHIGKFTLYCSFDCWGPQVEFIRYKANLKSWEENFSILINEYPEIDVSVHSTITSLSLDTLPDLVNKVKEYIKIRPFIHTVSTVDAREYLHPGIFPENFFKPQIDKLIEIYNEIIKILEEAEDEDAEYSLKQYITDFNHTIIQLKSYEKRFNYHETRSDLISELKSKLDVFDHRRKTNWRQLWPWLDQYPT